MKTIKKLYEIYLLKKTIRILERSYKRHFFEFNDNFELLGMAKKIEYMIYNLKYRE